MPTEIEVLAQEAEKIRAAIPPSKTGGRKKIIYPKAFTNRVAEASRASSLSVGAFAKRIGVADSALARWRSELPAQPAFVEVTLPRADVAVTDENSNSPTFTARSGMATGASIGEQAAPLVLVWRETRVELSGAAKQELAAVVAALRGGTSC